MLSGIFLVKGEYANASDYGSITTLSTDKPKEITLQEEMVVMMEYIVKMLYLFLWPLLAIAGASLDNSLVYGQIFYLDRSLWQFWQMMRTFANFALWFMLITSILFSFLSVGSKKMQLTSVLKNLFIAGILINMSRWLVAVMIDFSTVLTVNLWGLPIIAFSKTSDPNDPANGSGTQQVKYLTMHAQFDMDSTSDVTKDKADFTVAYSCYGQGTLVETKKYYLPCWIENGLFIKAGIKDSFLPEPQSWYGYKQGFVASRAKIWNWAVISNETIDDDWCTYQYDLLINCSTRPTDPRCGGDDGKLTSRKLEALKSAWAQEMTAKWCSTLEDFLTKAKGMTWPLYNLYATILNLWQIALSSNHQSLVETSVSLVMKVIVGIALMLPLFALAVVLIMRVVVLRVVIAFSPFLIVLYVFDFEVPGVGKKWSIGNILGLIFLPVFATFAISISVLFLTLIGRIDLIQNSQKVDALQVLWADKVTCDGKGDAGSADCWCYSFFGMSICVDQSTRLTWANILNVLSRLVTNFFGIALMRSVIFFALKSNDITWSVAWKIGSWWKSILSNTSMIPMPGAWGLSMVSPAALAAAWNKIGDMPRQKAQSDYQNSWLWNFVRKLDDRLSGSSTTSSPVETDKKLKDKLEKNNVQVDDVKKAVAEDKSYADYQQLAPALASAARASGKTVVDHGSDFIATMKDPGVMQYMQQNDLLSHTHWVKTTSPAIAQPQIDDYQKAVEQGLANSAGNAGILLSSDPANYKTLYRVPAGTDPNHPQSGYFTSVTKNATNITGISSATAYTPKPTPTTVTDWNTIGSIINGADIDLLTTNPSVASLFGSAITDINDALAASGVKQVTIANQAYNLTVVLWPGTRNITSMAVTPVP